jgi:hypothetical protein
MVDVQEYGRAGVSVKSRCTALARDTEVVMLFSGVARYVLYT